VAFLLNFQAQGASGKNEQSAQTPWRGAPEARGPMQLHRLKAGPANCTATGKIFVIVAFCWCKRAWSFEDGHRGHEGEGHKEK